MTSRRSHLFQSLRKIGHRLFAHKVRVGGIQIVAWQHWNRSVWVGTDHRQPPFDSMALTLRQIAQQLLVWSLMKQSTQLVHLGWGQKNAFLCVLLQHFDRCDPFQCGHFAIVQDDTRRPVDTAHEEHRVKSFVPNRNRSKPVPPLVEWPQIGTLLQLEAHVNKCVCIVAYLFSPLGQLNHQLCIRL